LPVRKIVAFLVTSLDCLACGAFSQAACRTIAMVRIGDANQRGGAPPKEQRRQMHDSCSVTTMATSARATGTGVPAARRGSSARRGPLRASGMACGSTPTSRARADRSPLGGMRLQSASGLTGGTIRRSAVHAVRPFTSIHGHAAPDGLHRHPDKAVEGQPARAAHVGDDVSGQKRVGPA
jgi:hypothetical protein